jgi:hypothetical protein
MSSARTTGYASIIALLLCVLYAASSPADDAVSTSGRLSLRGIEELENDSIRENPSLEGRLKLDAGGSAWRLHSWVEGGFDGTAKRPARDHALFKNYDAVYQSNSPYLEFKDLFVAYSGALDIRAGIQRFAWGRLDEYPVNDLFNPWDYTQFLIKPLEDRKIGVPSVSASLNKNDWYYETVWVPVFVPYRLPMPDERWSGSSLASTFAQTAPNAKLTPQEPELPERTLENGSLGARMKHTGSTEWAVDLFHGYDTRPVFKATALSIIPKGSAIEINPGYVPDFHKIDVIGVDAATAMGALSLRAEAAYAFNRYLNIRRELWGYPAVPAPGIHPLNPIELKRDTLDYGIAADYRLFEDGLLTIQVQQTLIFGDVDLLYERKIETLLWANLKVSWLNQKVETNASVAYNPEHGDTMTRANVWYVFTDFWKAGVTAVSFAGPSQSLFGKYAKNDQIGAELVYAW